MSAGPETEDRCTSLTTKPLHVCARGGPVALACGSHIQVKESLMIGCIACVRDLEGLRVWGARFGCVQLNDRDPP